MPDLFQNPVMFMHADIVHEWQYTPCKENSSLSAFNVPLFCLIVCPLIL